MVIDRLKAVVLRVRLELMRRNQHDSAALRALFRERYAIDVGMQSYGCFDRWRMPGPMRVGRYCSIANTVRSALNNHPVDAMTTHPALYERKFGVVDQDKAWTGELVIEDDVWIGHNAVILAGCGFIGRGAVIGAGAIVTKPVDRYAIVAGNPARKIRDRFAPELAAALDESRWWEMEPAELRALLRERPDLVMHPTVERIAEWRNGK